eukprot:311929-Amphidinium_carterae.1
MTNTEGRTGQFYARPKKFVSSEWGLWSRYGGAYLRWKSYNWNKEGFRKNPRSVPLSCFVVAVSFSSLKRFTVVPFATFFQARDVLQ